MPKLWAANLVSRQLPPFSYFALSSESAVTPTCQSARPKGFVSVLLYPLHLSSSCHSEYSAMPVSQRLLSRGAVVPTLRAHPCRKTKNCELLVRVGQQSLDLFINDAGRLFAVLLVRLTAHWQENRLPLSFQSDQT